MLDARPREREAVSWALVAGWTGVIWLTIPFAPALRARVEAAWGREAFLTFTFAVIALVFVVLVVWLRRRAATFSARACLAAIAGVYAWYAWQLRAIPEEAIHLLEYGLLGVLAYRALAHRVHDPTIYLSATAIGAIVGLIDEALQWLAPGRHWTLGDIWINVAAAALAQAAIATGLRPRLIGSAVSGGGIRLFCRFAACALVLLALTLLNTPARIEWYATRVPALGFLITNESVMFEYGYLYRDAETGNFRSRLSPEALRSSDARRAARAGPILDAYPNARYREFLVNYTPVSDPFLHEARVHLFSRDKHLELARDPSIAAEKGWHATVAWRENRILEKYFGATLSASSRELSPEDKRYLDRVRVPWEQVPADERESWVSRTLVTEVREDQIMAAVAVLLAILLAVERLAATRSSAGESVEETRA